MPRFCRTGRIEHFESRIRKRAAARREAGTRAARKGAGLLRAGPAAASASFRRSPTAPTRSRLRWRWSLAGSCRSILPFERARLSREPRQSTARASGSTRCSSARPACSSCPAIHERQLDAYVMTGRATVAHCDMLIAVWDGLPPRGRGGTGEVVQLAITHGTAIIHLPLDAAGDTRAAVERVRSDGAHRLRRSGRRAAARPRRHGRCCCTGC